MSEWESAERAARLDHMERLVLRGADPEAVRAEFGASAREMDAVRKRVRSVRAGRRRRPAGV